MPFGSWIFRWLSPPQRGVLQPLDDLIRRDGIDEKDWVLPGMPKVFGHIYALPQDIRIPILIYRKHLLEEAKVRPPRTWDEACEVGGKLTKGNVIGYAVPIGVARGLRRRSGVWRVLSQHPPAVDRDGKYFAEDHKTIAFSKEPFLKAAQTIKDLFLKCKASTPVSLQFGFNETHDGLRAGTIAMATFGLFRYAAIRRGGAGDDLAWAPPPGYTAEDPQTVYGFNYRYQRVLQTQRGSLDLHEVYDEPGWRGSYRRAVARSWPARRRTRIRISPRLKLAISASGQS